MKRKKTEGWSHPFSGERRQPPGGPQDGHRAGEGSGGCFYQSVSLL